jgi:hypothetical protein
MKKSDMFLIFGAGAPTGRSVSAGCHHSYAACGQILLQKSAVTDPAVMLWLRTAALIRRS